jgi:phenylpropionate dioxygenase-like ring-hydroxylating dioxygenase large terminal subunit
MFLRNAWYVAAWEQEIGEGPLARTLLGDPVVMFRAAGGEVVALEDRCCHRHLPLSLGKVVGDEIECGYHGLRFGRDGRCTKVPGQSRIPPGAAVRRYPIAKRWGWVWIWMGDPARADERLVPNWWFMDHPGWKVIPGNGAKPLHTKCNYQLITDNLLDLSHVGYVHPDTIGSDEIVKFPVKTERAADRVTMTRLMPDVPPPPFHKWAGGFTGHVDRWMKVEAIVPCYVDVDVGSADAGSGATEPKPPPAVAYHALNVPTPETETTTHFFYGHARVFKTASAEMDEVYRRDFLRIFMEDVTVVEAQQAALDRAPGMKWVDINVDAPGIAMRNLLGERIAAEAGG